MAVDPGGRYLYAANHSNDTISAYRIDSGVLTPLVGSPFLLGVGTGPQAIAIDTTGTFLYVANSGSNNVSGFMIMADTGVLSPINSGTPFGAGTTPVFILAEPAGKYLYVGNQGSTNITGFSYDATTGKLTAISGSPFTVPSAPGMMTIAH
jgi:6-phosphogluconolactonase (cycloisomerase 2 family)